MWSLAVAIDLRASDFLGGEFFASRLCNCCLSRSRLSGTRTTRSSRLARSGCPMPVAGVIASGSAATTLPWRAFPSGRCRLLRRAIRLAVRAFAACLEGQRHYSERLLQRVVTCVDRYLHRRSSFLRSCPEALSPIGSRPTLPVADDSRLAIAATSSTMNRRKPGQRLPSAASPHRCSDAVIKQHRVLHTNGSSGTSRPDQSRRVFRASRAASTCSRWSRRTHWRPPSRLLGAGQYECGD